MQGEGIKEKSLAWYCQRQQTNPINTIKQNVQKSISTIKWEWQSQICQAHTTFTPVSQL